MKSATGQSLQLSVTQRAGLRGGPRSVADRARRSGGASWLVRLLSVVLILGFLCGSALGQQARANGPLQVPQLMPNDVAGVQPVAAPDSVRPSEDLVKSLTDADRLLSPSGLTATLKILLLLTVLSLAPSILIMTTCFVRFVVVFGLLRQALGTQQLPPTQVLISLSLFLTFAVMAPVWREAYEQGIRPYTNPPPGTSSPPLSVAFRNTVRPLRRFMFEQIERTNNFDAVWLLWSYQDPQINPQQEPTYDDVPLSVLLPAYMLSELKTAFVIGFQIYLPFLILDMVVSSVLVSMGMMMLPPVLISLPLKLLLFVLVDGWYLTVGMLLESVRTATG